MIELDILASVTFYLSLVRKIIVMVTMVTVPTGYKLIISRMLGMHGIY